MVVNTYAALAGVGVESEELASLVWANACRLSRV
jgi:hypothetical protein